MVTTHDPINNIIEDLVLVHRIRAQSIRLGSHPNIIDARAVLVGEPSKRSPALAPLGCRRQPVQIIHIVLRHQPTIRRIRVRRIEITRQCDRQSRPPVRRIHRPHNVNRHADLVDPRLGARIVQVRVGVQNPSAGRFVVKYGDGDDAVRAGAPAFGTRCVGGLGQPFCFGVD